MGTGKAMKNNKKPSQVKFVMYGYWFGKTLAFGRIYNSEASFWIPASILPLSIAEKPSLMYRRLSR